MQKLFDEVGSLDRRCYDDFYLSEDILMEHAAEGMAAFIREKFAKDAKVIVVTGSGNNGADGIALTRLIHGDYDVSLLHAKEPKSPMAQLQQKRADALGVPILTQLQPCDVLVEAIVGTGFQGKFSTQLTQLIQEMNTLDSYKIACDMPSPNFFADTTLTMGALKKSLFLDTTKEYVGEIHVIDLGISRKLYERESNWYLLDEEDLELPHRKQKNSHKGSYGHLAVLSGEKLGASVLSASAALRFGTGLVTLIGYEKEQFLNIPSALMYGHALPQTTSAIALGMGLGEEFSDKELLAFLDTDLPLIIDADLFYKDIILKLLKRKNIVLTPHPKEFVSLLKLTGIADISVETLQNERFEYAELFCKKYPHATLLLKGANVIIGQNEKFYVNPHGSAKLAKGGSGDVLSGLIGALLAQGFEALHAAIHASLAHTTLAKHYSGADFSLTPNDLIEQIGKL
ncbi:NAD(P)H-hydrate dehydratase [Sulfurimonas paralvinellae]|uniref:ADP-dependent (S)-NAD(P)H-hydrate dehydratase n=1 Tax=Sulfurimonas paralvinellae TaxID=317658 RepID=A0A7M1B5F3_9BACT|nr:NAD(P)H-hydrate dehydratase [Sulfurimonas paralvinellae]QOP44900.1 NAD(P)H-hydrate dehydratase [Sulfurimonas paralvinellae]